MTITPELVSALCAGLAAIITAVGYIVVQLRKIHTLVNSRLSTALLEIKELRLYIAQKSGDPKEIKIAGESLADLRHTIEMDG